MAAILLAFATMTCSAGAARAAGWSAPGALPTGAANPDPGSAGGGAAQVLTSPTGETFLLNLTSSQTVEWTPLNQDGSLDTPTQVPGLSDVEELGRVDFLPNGDSVMQVSNDSGSDFIYRSADGTWGTPLSLDSTEGGALAFGVSAGELLVVSSFDDGSNYTPLTATSYPVSNANFGAATSSIAIGGASGQAAVFSDPNDQVASVVFSDQASGDIEEVDRSGSGSWSSPTVTVPGQRGDGFSISSDVVAPDGRGIIALSHLTDNETVVLDWATREPGAYVGALQSEQWTGSPVGLTSILTAAGPDGTLALGVSPVSCSSTSAAASGSLETAVFAPGTDQATLSDLPGGDWIADAQGNAAVNTLTALGAGHGQAVAGITTQGTSSESSGQCTASVGPQIYSTADAVALIGGFNAGTTSLADLPGNDSSGQYVPLGLVAVGIDAIGNSTAVGDFNAGPGYSTLQAPAGSTPITMTPAQPSPLPTTTAPASALPPTATTPASPPSPAKPAVPGSGAPAKTAEQSDVIRVIKTEDKVIRSNAEFALLHSFNVNPRTNAKAASVKLRAFAGLLLTAARVVSHADATSAQRIGQTDWVRAASADASGVKDLDNAVVDLVKDYRFAAIRAERRAKVSIASATKLGLAADSQLHLPPGS